MLDDRFRIRICRNEGTFGQKATPLSARFSNVIPEKGIPQRPFNNWIPFRRSLSRRGRYGNVLRWIRLEPLIAWTSPHLVLWKPWKPRFSDHAEVEQRKNDPYFFCTMSSAPEAVTLKHTDYCGRSIVRRLSSLILRWLLYCESPAELITTRFLVCHICVSLLSWETLRTHRLSITWLWSSNIRARAIACLQSQIIHKLYQSGVCNILHFVIYKIEIKI